MDRRATLTAFLGKLPNRQSSAPSGLGSSLTPYDGPWDIDRAAHLIRRACIGAGWADIQQAAEAGLEATLEQLFAEQGLPDPPINFFYEDDPNVAIGESWVDAPYIADGNLLGYRNQSLRAWQMITLLQEGCSIREKLTLFWHNHFAVGNINDPKYVYRHINLLRQNAWGNFRELIKAITIDPAMLRFLNGNQNTKESPNENFARELLELYTIGKGPQVGPGDYTNYTEQDVKEIARVLTGWRDTGYLAVREGVQVGSVYLNFRHDNGRKTLSHRFNNEVISNNGENEYKDAIDIIFQQREVARFIARKLYRWFVYYQIDEMVEQQIIEPMAQLLIDHDFEIKPALTALLQSAHFFDALNIGPMIKNPIDFSIGMIKQNQIAFPDNLLLLYRISINLFRFIGLMQMEYFNPPDVAGWKAYYQAPAYYRIWINAATLRPRMQFTDAFSTVGVRVGQGQVLQIDVFSLIAGLEQASDPNELVRALTQRYFPQPLTDQQYDGLKAILIPGLPDYEWTVEYNAYLRNPSDQGLKAAIETKLRVLLRTMLSMPEYYLS